jgi:hypothetical protein
LLDNDFEMTMYCLNEINMKNFRHIATKIGNGYIKRVSDIGSDISLITTDLQYVHIFSSND